MTQCLQTLILATLLRYESTQVYLFYLYMSILTATASTHVTYAIATATASETETSYIYTTRWIANLVCLCLFWRLQVINMRNRPCKNWCHINSHGMQQIISSKNICNDNLANQWQIEITTTTWKDRMKRIFLSLMFKNTWITTKTQGHKIVIVLPWLNSDHATHTFTDMQNMLGLVSKQLW
jgi:hypothetical protein